MTLLPASSSAWRPSTPLGRSFLMVFVIFSSLMFSWLFKYSKLLISFSLIYNADAEENSWIWMCLFKVYCVASTLQNAKIFPGSQNKISNCQYLQISHVYQTEILFQFMHIFFLSKPYRLCIKYIDIYLHQSKACRYVVIILVFLLCLAHFIQTWGFFSNSDLQTASYWQNWGKSNKKLDFKIMLFPGMEWGPQLRNVELLWWSYPFKAL